MVRGYKLKKGWKFVFDSGEVLEIEPNTEEDQSKEWCRDIAIQQFRLFAEKLEEELDSDN